ncbi:hypothetical protein, partial [Coxiella burnetii]|uniref:hypothetical protein n=1 Tax=Coxiella burnetii TaxID=777 RepID=UPI0022315C9C
GEAVHCRGASAINDLMSHHSFLLKVVNATRVIKLFSLQRKCFGREKNFKTGHGSGTVYIITHKW